MTTLNPHQLLLKANQRIHCSHKKINYSINREKITENILFILVPTGAIQWLPLAWITDDLQILLPISVVNVMKIRAFVLRNNRDKSIKFFVCCKNHSLITIMVISLRFDYDPAKDRESAPISRSISSVLFKSFTLYFHAAAVSRELPAGIKYNYAFYLILMPQVMVYPCAKFHRNTFSLAVRRRYW